MLRDTSPGRIGADIAQTPIQRHEKARLAGGGCKHNRVFGPSEPFISHSVNVVLKLA